MYDPEDPNTRTSLKFVSVAGLLSRSYKIKQFLTVLDVQKLEEVILHPTLERYHYRQIGDCIDVSNTNTVTLYKNHSLEESSEAREDWHPEYAILSSLKASRKSLRLYHPGPDLESDFRTICCLDHKSSLKKPSRDILSKMDVEGGPDIQTWRESHNLRLPLGDHGGKYLNILETLWCN